MEYSEEMRVTFREIAKQAGVSIATVSHVINDSRPVNEDTRKRVLRVIEQLHYRPNIVARELRTGSSGLIGVLVIDHNPFYTDILCGIEEVVETAGWKVIVASTGENWKKQREVIDALSSRRVEGLFMAPAAGMRSEDWMKIKSMTPPTVFFDRIVEHVDVPTVTVANYEGAYIAVQHFVEHGHQNIGFICLNDEISTMRERYQGFSDACNYFNVRKSVTFGPATQAGGDVGMKKLLNGDQTPTGILVANNQMTIGALQCIRQEGLKIPNDIALIGFDYQDWMDVMNPPITVVTQPAIEIGRKAAELLMRLKGTNDVHVDSYVLGVSLRTRESCGCSKPH